MKHYVLMSILIFQFVCFTTQAEDVKSEKKFWGTFGGGYDFTFAFPSGTAEDASTDDFLTAARAIPVKARLGIRFGNELPSFVFLSAQKTFFIDPIEDVPDFGTGLGVIFSHRKNLYHLVEIGAKPTRDRGTFLELVVGEGIFLGPVIGESTLNLLIGGKGKEDSLFVITIGFALHFIFPIM